MSCNAPIRLDVCVQIDPFVYADTRLVHATCARSAARHCTLSRYIFCPPSANLSASGICAFPSGPSISKHAVLWEDGAARDLGTFGGRFNNFAFAINDRAQIVGQLDLPGDTVSHAFLWSKERGLRDLGTLPGDVSSSAAAINNEGVVIGGSCDANGNCRNVIWFDGAPVDFNALLTKTPVQIVNLNDINDLGLAVGGAFDPRTGQAPAFVAIPTGNFISLADVLARSQPVVLPERIRALLKPQRLRGHF